jgi:predicted O-methyltransferase YrrM
MRWSELRDAFAGSNLLTLRLALRDRDLARSFVSTLVRHYDELMGLGLKDKNPVSYIYKRNGNNHSLEDRVVLPANLDDDSGTRLDEMLILAAATKALRPNRVFEIGTYNGRTTSIFALNAPESATIFTLDLPPGATVEDDQYDPYINTDIDLVKARKADNFIVSLNLTDRCQQLYCDSMQFDPTPYRGSIDLGFIDGAHALPYVQNDTEKMASMMSENGLVFWHDYGGKGRFRPLADYLESLGRRAPVYRVMGTTLAWAPANSLRSILFSSKECQPTTQSC